MSGCAACAKRAVAASSAAGSNAGGVKLSLMMWWLISSRSFLRPSWAERRAASSEQPMATATSACVRSPA